MFQNKKNNSTKGQAGEELALQYLVKKGYKLLDRNWRYGRNEIDLVFDYHGVVVFVEVKLRHPDTLVEAHMTVNKTKQRAIVKTADAWLKEHETEAECRFDIVAILFVPGREPEINHLEHAFYAFM